MKTKNMRKKALVASLAMLLVAVVALTGATYAWFSANSAATVNGIKLQSTTASSLQFSDGTGATQADWTWAYTYNLNAGTKTLTPASSLDADSFYTANAATTNPGVGDNTKVASISGSNSNDYYTSSTFYVRAGADGSLKLTGITGAGALAGALRIAVTVDGSTTIFSAASETNPRALNGSQVDVPNTTTYNDLYSTTTLNCTAPQTLGTVGSTSIYSLSAGIAKPITITIWLEGNDSQCNDDMANKSSDMTNGLVLSFSL